MNSSKCPTKSKNLSRFGFKFERVKSSLRLLRGGQVAVQGSRYTSNLGDIAAGDITRDLLKSEVTGPVDLFDFCEGEFPRHEMFLIGGGGGLYDFRPGTLLRRLSPADSCGKAAMVGVGVQGDLSSVDMVEVSRLLKRFSYISVRDKHSQLQLKMLGAKDPMLSVCPVLSLSVNRPKVRTSTIGVSVRPWFERDDQYGDLRDSDSSLKSAEFHEYLISHLRREASSRKLLFLPTAVEDYQVYDVLKKSVDIDCASIGNWRDLVKVIAGCDVVYAMRYHSMLFSVAADTPFIPLAYAEKSREFLDRFFPDEKYLDVNCPETWSLLDGGDWFRVSDTQRGEMRSMVRRDINQLAKLATLKSV